MKSEYTIKNERPLLAEGRSSGSVYERLLSRKEVLRIKVSGGR